MSDNGELSKYCDEVRDDSSLLTNISSDTWRARLIKTMKKWSILESSLTVQRFCIDYNLSRRTLLSWAKAYPDVYSALEDMKINIACNREEGALTSRLNAMCAHKNIHAYDAEWHEVNKYHSDMKKEEVAAGVNYITVEGAKKNITTKEQLAIEVGNLE